MSASPSSSATCSSTRTSTGRAAAAAAAAAAVRGTAPSSPLLPPPPLMPLLLLLLLLLQLPTPTTSTLYVQPGSGSTGSSGTTPFRSEPAMFGRVFDGQITGRGNLFLPPVDVDPTLCGGIWGRAAAVAAEADMMKGQEEGQEGSVGGDGGRRKLLRGINSAERQRQQQQLAGGRGRRRRLLDELRPVDAELTHRYLLATSSDGSTLFPATSSTSSSSTAADQQQKRRQLHKQHWYDEASAKEAAAAAATSSSSSVMSMAEPNPPRPIALLVERGGCTFHEKAVNAMALNQFLLQEAVIISRDSRDRQEDGTGVDDNRDDAGEEEGGNRRKYDFPEKGEASTAEEGEDEGASGGGGGGGGRRRQRGRRLQKDGDDADADADADADGTTVISNTFDDEDEVIEEGLESVMRDPDKSEVGTATPADLMGSPFASSSGSQIEVPTLRIDYIVIYNDEISASGGREDELVLMDRPKGSNDYDKVDMGLVFISRRSGLEIRRRMDEQLAAMYDDAGVQPSAGDVSPIEDGDPPLYHVTPYDLFPSTVAEKHGWLLPITVDSKSELGPYNTGWPRGTDARDSFYWIRFALIALLIITPVARGCFVWRGAGGRVEFRRNDSGWIVGLHVVRPAGRWFDGWEDWEQGPNGENVTSRIRKMTHDEVLNLPEIEYSRNDEGDENEMRDDADDAMDEADRHGVEAAPAPQALPASDVSSSSEGPVLHTTTTCTSCSICIDEYEPGEKIRLLPRCGHAFHTDCIMPWLTERSGSCPLCKQNVMGGGTDGLEEEERGEGGPAGAGDSDEDDNSIIDESEAAMREEEEVPDEEEQRPEQRSPSRNPISRDTVRSSSSARTRRARRQRRNRLDA